MSPKVEQIKQELEALKVRSRATDEKSQQLKREAASSVKHAELVKQRLLSQ